MNERNVPFIAYCLANAVLYLRLVNERKFSISYITILLTRTIASLTAELGKMETESIAGARKCLSLAKQLPVEAGEEKEESAPEILNSSQSEPSFDSQTDSQYDW